VFSNWPERAQLNGLYRQEMISMLLWVYLCGSLVAAAGSSVASDLLSRPDVPAATRTKVIVFAAVAWPVLLVGLLQLICIGGLARALSADPSDRDGAALGPGVHALVAPACRNSGRPQ
jgi:hypothetical protein